MFKEMNTTWFKAYRIFVVALLITMTHFILTSVISHYISIQIGTQMGQVVAEGLIEAYETSPQKSEEEAKRISQDMNNKRYDIIEKWKISLILISLPLKPLMNPFLKNIMDARIKMVLSKEISKEQFYKRGIMIDYAAKFVNSLSLGLLVYIILRIVKYYKMKT
jgi:hypothetical protein